MNRRDVLRFCAAAVAFEASSFLTGGPASAAASIVLKASDVHPLGYPTVEAVIRLGKKFEAGTKGKYTLQMFPAMQLGPEKQALEQVQIGALAMTRVSVGAIGPVVDEVNVFNLPFVFRDEVHMRRVIDGNIGTELLGKIGDDPKSGLIGLAFMDSGTRSIFNKVRPINKVADLKGLKIRMQENPIYIDTMNALGAIGVPLGMDEVYHAIAAGMVDGAENNPPTYVTQNWHSVAPYFSLTEHLIVPEILVCSKKVWQKFTADEQALLARLSREAQFEERQLWDAKVAESMDKLKAAGARINKVVDKAGFQAAVKPVWDKHGARFASLIERIEAR